jgi:type I restriction enzyme M protein
MSDQEHEVVDSADAAEEEGSENFFIDILTGNKESSTPRKLLNQKVLRQLIES